MNLKFRGSLSPLIIFERIVFMRILGIDPGYAIIGYGIVDFTGGRYKALTYGAITTSSDMPFVQRLEVIYNELEYIISKTKPEVSAIERLYFQNNQKTAIDVAQARGVILLAMQKNSIPVFEYTPLQIKTAVTGYGRAKKPQIMEIVRRHLHLESVPKPDDTADALAVALCHGQSAGTRLKIILNQGGNTRGTLYPQASASRSILPKTKSQNIGNQPKRKG